MVHPQRLQRHRPRCSRHCVVLARQPARRSSRAALPVQPDDRHTTTGRITSYVRPQSGHRSRRASARGCPCGCLPSVGRVFIADRALGPSCPLVTTTPCYSSRSAQQFARDDACLRFVPRVKQHHIIPAAQAVRGPVQRGVRARVPLRARPPRVRKLHLMPGRHSRRPSSGVIHIRRVRRICLTVRSIGMLPLPRPPEADLQAGAAA